jgi:hypothetical protein
MDDAIVHCAYIWCNIIMLVSESYVLFLVFLTFQEFKMLEFCYHILLLQGNHEKQLSDDLTDSNEWYLAQ